MHINTKKYSIKFHEVSCYESDFSNFRCFRLIKTGTISSTIQGDLPTTNEGYTANYPLLRSVFLFSADQFSTLSRSSDLLHSDH